MNPVQKAISDLKHKIPKEVLAEAFIDRDFGSWNSMVSVDARIREEVLNSRVLPDCNLVGGTLTTIPLSHLRPEHSEYYSLVYRIPKSLTQGKAITRVMNIHLMNGALAGASVMGVQGYSQPLDAASGVASAQAAIPMVSSAYVRLIGENTILVTNNTQIPANIALSCYLENDGEMQQLKATTYHRFAKLVELAVKAYIYNNLNIRIGDAHLQGGKELGRFREYVDSLADSNELYETYLEETWRVIAVIDDPQSYENHLRMLVGGHQ